MFFRLFALFALVAVAFASPSPNPKADPQLLAYGAGVFNTYPYYAGGVYGAAPYAALPYAYNGYFIR